VLCPFVLSAKREQTPLGSANKTREVKFHDEKKKVKKIRFFFSLFVFFVRDHNRASRRVIQTINRFFSRREELKPQPNRPRKKKREKKRGKKDREREKKKKNGRKKNVFALTTTTGQRRKQCVWAPATARAL
jgi:hypothetical protein